jgi:hypothetical protein
MKHLIWLLSLVAICGCECSQPPVANPETDKVEKTYPLSDVRCVEFNRPTTRKGESWTCRVLFCDSASHAEGGPTTLWCDKDTP